MALGSGVSLLFPQLVRLGLNSEFSSYPVQHPTQTFLVLLALFATQAVAFYYRAYLFGVLGQRVVAELRDKLYSSSILRDVQFFDETRSAELVSRISSDSALIQDAISIKLSVFIRYSFQVLAGILLMATISWRLTLAILVLLPVLVGISIFLGKSLRVLSRLQQTALASSSSIAQETFAAARIVKAFGREAFEILRFSKSNATILDIGMRRSKLSAFFSSFVNFLMNIFIIGMLLFGFQLVADGSLSSGDLTAFLLYGAMVAVSFAFVAGGYAEFVQSLGASDRVFELLGNARKIISPASRRILEHGRAVEIVFDKVSFAYPNRSNETVLNDLSFSLAPGKVTALVGPSGTGKSTIVSLLLGFYRPTSGAIKLDGVNFADFSAEDLRREIALVPQDPQLFGVSIAENLRYGRENATLQDLEAVCGRVNMLEFVQSLPQGFDTNPGEGGVQLSGGQKQRLAIARALLRNPGLLILDEATSALDSENEALVHETISSLMKDKTVLVIAHRLSTIRHANQVLVLQRGKLVQSGTHDQLAKEPGLYRQMVERQELLGSE